MALAAAEEVVVVPVAEAPVVVLDLAGMESPHQRNTPAQEFPSEEDAGSWEKVRMVGIEMILLVYTNQLLLSSSFAIPPKRQTRPMPYLVEQGQECRISAGLEDQMDQKRSPGRQEDTLQESGGASRIGDTWDQEGETWTTQAEPHSLS